jgi:selenoprotein W-related protein
MLLKINLVYCVVWHYIGRATSLAAELLNEFEPDIESITLVPSDGGRFEFSINGKLLYSKLETHRHAEPGEIAGLVRKYLDQK